MMSKTDVRRRVYTHNSLIGAAKDFSMLAQHSKGEFDAAMASALFCALSLEAVINHVGSSLLPLWDQHLKRKLSPEGKLTLIASFAHLQIDFGKKPFQAFRV